jgi:hypothetical protein
VATNVNGELLSTTDGSLMVIVWLGEVIEDRPSCCSVTVTLYPPSSA